MTRVAEFVPGEELLVSWLGSQAGPGRRVTSEMPQNPEADLPLWLVTAAPSSASDYVTARPTLDVEVFAAHTPGRSAMWAEAAAMHEAMRLLGYGQLVDLYDEAGAVRENVLIDGVTVVSDPVHRFWSASVDRAVAVYQIHLRPAG